MGRGSVTSSGGRKMGITGKVCSAGNPYSWATRSLDARAASGRVDQQLARTREPKGPRKVSSEDREGGAHMDEIPVEQLAECRVEGSAPRRQSA